MKIFVARSALVAASVVVFLFGAPVAPAHAQTFTVTTTADAGPGSLRDAIAEVNLGNVTVIDMSGLTGTISLVSPLPTITNAVTINGSPFSDDLTIEGAGTDTVVFDTTAVVTLNNLVIGDGLVKAGTGEVIWQGHVQSYSEPTAVTGGTFSLPELFNVTSPVSAVTLGEGTLLDIPHAAQVGSLNGSGTVQLGATASISAGSDHTSTTFNGAVVGGATFVKTGAGTMTFGAGSSMDADNLQVFGGTVLLGQSMTMHSVGVATVLDLGANTLTLIGGLSDSEVSFGTLTGAGGSLHLTGTATMDFLGLMGGGGTGTYTGTTTVSGDASLVLLGDQTLSEQTRLILNDNGFIQIGATLPFPVGGTHTYSGLSGDGGELFLSDDSALTIDQDIDTAFAGALSGDALSTFIKAGTGRLTLSGDGSAFLGSMAVSGGVLEGTTDSLTVDILNNATVELDQAFDGSYDGAISGTGALVKSGAGAVELTSASSYTGGTVVNAGTLVVGADDALGLGALTMNGGTLQVDFLQDVSSLSGAAGTVLVDGVLGIDQDSDTTFGGTFAGSGDIDKLGAGMLTLTGPSTFTGELAVLGGTLALGGADVLSSTEFISVVDSAEVRLLSNQAFIDMDVEAGGTLAIGSHTLTLNSGPLGSLIDGNITGTGAIVVGGVTGLAVFSAVDFSGALTFGGDSESFLLVENAFDPGVAVTVNDNAYLQLDDHQTFSSLSGNGGEIFLCDCAALTIDQAGDSTFAGILSGDPDATFTKQGAGRLMLTGDGSMFVGTMNASGGILAGTTDSLQADITNNAIVEFEQAFDGEFLGAISGTGSVIKSGTGMVELTSASTYAGGTTMNAGTLVADDDGALGAGALTINGGLLGIGGSNDVNVLVTSLSGSGGAIEIAAFSTLMVDQATDTTFGGAFSGDGILQKLGSGTLSFDGAEMDGTSVQVTEGVLRLASENVLAGTGGLLADGGHVTLGANQAADDFAMQVDSLSSFDLGAHTLTLGGSSGVVVLGTMAGDGGSLHVRGDAQVIFFLGGRGTYTGTTTVSGNGELYLVDDQSLSAQSALVVNDNGYVDFGGAQTVSSLSGTGGELFFCACGSLTVDQAIDTTFAGAITSDTGAGSLVKAGSGRLLLTGTNTYEGGTTVAGGILAGSTASLQGSIENNATVEFAQTGSGIFDGVMSGTGALVKSGAGTVSFTAANTYTGGTTLEAGTLIVAAPGALGSGSLTVNAGLLDLNASHTAAALAGMGGTVDIFATGVLTVDQAAATTFAGALMGGGALVKSGSGTLTLTGTSSYTGGTTVLAGTLAGNTNSLQGAILNNATVQFTQGADGTFAGAVTGSGGVVKTGGGTLFVSGTLHHGGGTFVLGGTLAGSAASFDGAIVNHARVEFVQHGDGAFDGLISGTGSVVKSGGGTLVFSGANSYAGGTTIAGGTLMVGSDASLGAAAGALTFEGGVLGLLGDFVSMRDVVLNGAGTFDTGAHDALLAGSLAGAGAFTKIGSGALILSGAASHTGGTRVLDGVLVGSTASIQGGILNQALVVFDQPGDGAFGGSMSGSGSVVKIGAGELTVTGVQTYSGDTIVFEGGLRLDGSLAGSVFVDSGATFGGSGTVGGDVFVDGTFTAGGLPGGAGGGSDTGAGAHAVIPPMAIQGDLLLTGGAVYQAQIDEDASIATMHVGGTAVIDGATLHLVETAAGIDIATRRASSTVLTAADIQGGFGAITGLGGAFDPYLFAFGGDLSLLLIRNNVDFSLFADTSNGSGVGAALASVQAGAEGDLAFVVRELAALATDAELAAALDRISGAAHASFAGLSMIGSADVIDVLTARFAGRSGWWAQGLGSSLSLDAGLDPGASSATTRGLMAGYDRRWARGMAGAAGGYHDSDIDASGGLDRIDGRAYRGAIYGQLRAGRIVVDGIVSAASHRVRGSRVIGFAATLDPAFGGGLLFGGVDRAAAFDYRAVETAAVADAGYVIDVAGFVVQPSLGVQLTRIGRDGFTESGAEALDLSAASANASSLAGRARLSIERRFDRTAGRWVAPRAGVRYTRELRDRDVPFAASIAGAPFTVSGFALPRSLFAARAGIAAGFGVVTLSIDYRAAVAAGHRHHLISAGFGF